jgi:hypothetical protein
MSLHRYAPRALAGDYARAGIGLAVTGGPMIFLRPAAVVAVVLGALATIFALFALRTALRQFSVIEVTADAIRAHGPTGKSMAWDEIDRVRLDYYTTRRESGAGWMQLKLGAGRGRIRIDSTVGDFDRIVAAVAAAARGADMTETTRGNFRALGITAPEAREPRT